MNKIEKEALNYLKDNKKEFLEKYLNGYEVQEIKTAIFTAGASGAGKTEYAISRKEKEPFLLHMDFDTTLLIKSIFQDAIILNIFDRENDIIHEDVDEKQFYILLAGEIL